MLRPISVLVTVLVASAVAASTTTTVFLTPSQVVMAPSAATTAYGVASVSVDSAASSVTLDLSLHGVVRRSRRFLCTLPRLCSL